MFQQKTPTTVDIADIFYDLVEATSYTENHVCVGIYNDPLRYPRLLAIANTFELKAAFSRYKECILNDIKHRRATDVLRSRLA